MNPVDCFLSGISRVDKRIIYRVANKMLLYDVDVIYGCYYDLLHVLKLFQKLAAQRGVHNGFVGYNVVVMYRFVLKVKYSNYFFKLHISVALKVALRCARHQSNIVRWFLPRC